MFVRNNTFILGISASKEHFSIAPEKITLDRFINRYIENNYKYSKMIFKIKWTDKINYDLIYDIVKLNIEEKFNLKTFWRKNNK